MLKDGKLAIDPKDDVVKGAMVINAGEVVHVATHKAIDPTWVPPAPPSAPTGRGACLRGSEGLACSSS